MHVNLLRISVMVYVMPFFLEPGQGGRGNRIGRTTAGLYGNMRRPTRYMRLHEDPCVSTHGSLRMWRLVVARGQILRTSNEVSLNSSYCWEYTKISFDSEFEIAVMCPRFRSQLPNLERSRDDP